MLDSPAKPERILKRAQDLGLKSIAVTDHGTISGCPEFHKVLSKGGVKPILGIEQYLCKDDPSIKAPENRSLSHLCMLAKNLKGWQQLIRLTSESNRRENFYYKPRLDLKNLANFLDGNIIGFSGHPGSDLANVLFTDYRAAYDCKTRDEVRAYIHPDWVARATALAYFYEEIFGKGNFYIEIQGIDEIHIPASWFSMEGLRYISKITGIPCAATADAHYAYPEDSELQQILLCIGLKTTLSERAAKMADGEDVGLANFFKSSNYAIPSHEDLSKINRREEIENTLLIDSMCESYKIDAPPRLPKFPTPDGSSDIEYLRKLCREGWSKRIKGKNLDEALYSERIKMELDVADRASLAGYFNIVQDYVNWYKSQGWLAGVGRGSAAGCLISYLTRITEIDPVKYKLRFERFYNAGRIQEGRNALPDIDSDFMSSHRQDVINYIKDKYGKPQVAQLCTISSLKGRAALKDVFRVTAACDFETMNEITKHVPDEAAISDELQDMREAGEEPSIIMWALLNNRASLEKYCYIDDKGNLKGEFAKSFEQAIKLEGCKRNISRHASGFVIADSPIGEVAPMIYDKGGEDPIIGFDMRAAEQVGLVKFDLLNTAILDKMYGCLMDIKEQAA
jgi:DNA polymerase-3 subunit alpha